MNAKYLVLLISKKKVDFLSKAFLNQQKSICNTFGETIDEKFELALFYMDYYGLAKKKIYEIELAVHLYPTF